MDLATAPIKRLKSEAQSGPQTPSKAIRITSGRFVTSRSRSSRAKSSASSAATAPARPPFLRSYRDHRADTGLVAYEAESASLLEVGTGFHPELTGRENIFLNGSILGMTHREIHRKFDEIVEFAGVEKFIDTPVKHYSSGM